jgi:hypothetical protein
MVKTKTFDDWMKEHENMPIAEMVRAETDHVINSLQAVVNTHIKEPIVFKFAPKEVKNNE